MRLDRPLEMGDWVPRILCCSTMGIGNLLLASPALVSLKSLGFEVSLLVDRNRGTEALYKNWSVVSKIYVNNYIQEKFDYLFTMTQMRPDWVTCNYGKWLNIEPNNGIMSDYLWRFKKHELLYYMDVPHALGYVGEVPLPYVPLPISGGFRFNTTRPRIAVGIGYLKNEKWQAKNWGPENFVGICNKLYVSGYQPILLGNRQDHHFDGCKITKLSPSTVSLCGGTTVAQSFQILSGCNGYIGNDTMLSHASAALGIPTLSIFIEGASNPIKNYPWGLNGFYVHGKREELTVDRVFDASMIVLKKRGFIDLTGKDSKIELRG